MSGAAVAMRARRALRRFGREEDGSLLIFGLFCFVMMLMLAGIALDLMRFEERRTTLQNTVDRAVLAAADLNQTLDPKEVVKDYFRKAGLTPPEDEDIFVEQGEFNEWRTVRANVSEEMPTWFMNMVGVPYLGTPADGTAEERIGQVEISLVLDVSGSMNSNNRLTNLIPAAKAFVDTMFDSVQEGKLSMNIITYSTQVSAGPELLSHFNVTNEQTTSDCIEFTTADMNTTAVDLTTRTYQRNGHFAPFGNLSLPDDDDFNCPIEANRDIIAYSGDRDALKSYIDGLTADGNTSIDIGVKWGAALLDPSMKPVVTDMIANGDAPEDFSERPYGYGDREALKVIVVMTDGANTTEYRLKPEFMTGTSRIRGNTAYSPTSLSQYSIYDPVRNQWWIIAKSMWRDEPWGDGTYQTCNRWGCTTNQDPGDSYAMTWPEVWERMAVNYLSGQLIKRAYGSTEQSNWSSSGNTVVTRIYSEKDNRTEAICSAAKDNGVTIFSIGFEAPGSGITLLRNCASTPANFYSVDGLDINVAFAAIASSINKLRLTH